MNGTPLYHVKELLGHWTIAMTERYAHLDLDVDNGFTSIRANVADIGANEQIGALLYILTDPRHAQETPLSAIVD